jgi:hypothetical protein
VDTASARSMSTGRSPSVPPVCEPPTPEPAEVAVDAPSAAVQPDQESASGAGLVVGNAGASGVGGGGAGTSEPAARQHGYPRSLLQHVEEPPAPPTIRPSNPLL